ncbi:MFS transporter [Bartonella sp. DGB2]|uniref:MFS transporter n=1 Tax=Bartonella sp. DGB2 TaxID=3388426 RepID=UPI0039900C04
MGRVDFIIILQLFACVLLTVASLSDEAAQIVFALNLAQEPRFVSMLLSTGLLCGIGANLTAPWLLHRFGSSKMILASFYGEALLIALAAFSQAFLAYIILAAALGCVLSMLWASVFVMIPDFADNEQHMDWINRIVQSLRNFGYVGGPLLGSMFFDYLKNTYGMLWMAVAVLAAGGIMQLCLKGIWVEGRYGLIAAPSKQEEPVLIKKYLDVVGLFRIRAVTLVLIPLIVTIIFISAEGVLLIIYIREVLRLDAKIYGFIASASSIGLVFGPLFFVGLFKRLGYAAGACMAATCIGFGVLCLAFSAQLWVMLLASLLIGIANGVQNALMASFMMKHIHKDQRKQQMPAYSFILQGSVLIGLIGAGFVDLFYIQSAFIWIGLISMAAGFIGTAVNFYSERLGKPQNA